MKVNVIKFTCEELEKKHPASKVNAIERFYSSIDKDENTGCWNYKTVPYNHGYCAIRVNKIKVLAHRFSYYLHKGDINPPNLFVCHTCDNPKCVNPDHLFLGTHNDNMNDMKNKGRGFKIPHSKKL